MLGITYEQNECNPYLPQYYTGVRIFDCRKSSVRVDVDVRGFLAFVELDELVHERDGKLFEDDVDLAGTVSATSCIVKLEG